MTSRITYNGNDIEKTIPFTRECYKVITDEDYQPLPQYEQERVTRHMVEIRAVIDKQRDAVKEVERLGKEYHRMLVSGGYTKEQRDKVWEARREALARLQVAAWRTCMIEEVYQ